MSHVTEHLDLRRISRPIAAKVLALLLASVLVGSCTSGGSTFSNTGFGGLNLFGSSAPDTPETIVLARDPAALANGTGVERMLHNAIELSRQKRFTESRYLLAEVRDIQDLQSEGYQAVSGAMALLALREGDIAAFKRIARQLDASLGHPVRVDEAYVDVIGLYRAMNNRSLPVNAGSGVKELKQKFFGVQSAGT